MSTKAQMRETIDKLYRILSKRATENVLLHRRIEALTRARRTGA